MTLFTMLLVIIAERLFKLGEHWHLDHRLEVAFPPDKTFLVTGHAADDAGGRRGRYLIQRLLQGLCLTCRCWCSGFTGPAMHWRQQSSFALPRLS